MNLVVLTIHALLGGALFYFLAPGIWFSAIPAGKTPKEQAAVHAAIFTAIWIAGNTLLWFISHK
jgi:hypothetical protein